MKNLTRVIKLEHPTPCLIRLWSITGIHHTEKIKLLDWPSELLSQFVVSGSILPVLKKHPQKKRTARIRLAPCGG